MTKKVNSELRALCRVINDTVDVSKIYLFGSHAYGTPNRDSDYDLCVVMPDNDMRPIDAIKKIRRALFDIQTTPLDVLVYHHSRFEERRSCTSLESKIAKEGVLLYEQPEFGQRMV